MQREHEAPAQVLYAGWSARCLPCWSWWRAWPTPKPRHSRPATVAGLGLSVPIANRALAAETSVNLHAWVELEPSRAFGSGSGSAWAFVFGPSITVGNLGADL